MAISNGPRLRIGERTESKLEENMLLTTRQVAELAGCLMAYAEKFGDRIMPMIGKIAQVFPKVVFTRDWHPAGHGSFVFSDEV